MSKEVGQRLRKARAQKGLSQVQVKELTNINNKTLSGYENGVSEPDFDTIRILADLYGVTTDYLLGRTDNPAPLKTDDQAKIEAISIHDEIAREIQIYKESGITINRAAAQKIVEHRRRVMEGHEKGIDYIFQAKTLANALERLTELDIVLNLDDETMFKLVKKARDKYGLPGVKRTEPTAHSQQKTDFDGKSIDKED